MKKFVSGINSILMIVLMIGIICVGYYLAERHPIRYDLTENDSQSLSVKSLKIIEGLDQKVEVIGFFESGSQIEIMVTDILKELKRRSKNFSYRTIDPTMKPSEAKKYSMTEYGAIVISGEQQKKVGLDEIIKMSYNPYAQAPPEFYGEQAFINAIVAVTSTERKTICFVEGHAERDINSQEESGYGAVKTLLEGENYVIRSLNLAAEKSVPDECSVLSLIGAEKFLSSPEIESIDKYLDGGGNALVFVDPFENTGLDILLYKRGVVLGKDIVVDTESFYGEDPLTPIPQLKYHAITTDLRKSKLTVSMPGARSVSKADVVPDGTQIDVLMESSLSGWGETDLENQNPEQDENDIDGPVPLAVAVTQELDAGDGGEIKQSRLIVAGDSDFASNGFTSMTPDVLKVLMGGAGNADLFVNMVNWLAGEEELISIRPKPADFKPLNITGPQKKRLFLIYVVLFPAFIILLGGVIWFWRRSR